MTELVGDLREFATEWDAIGDGECRRAGIARGMRRIADHYASLPDAELAKELAKLMLEGAARIVDGRACWLDLSGPTGPKRPRGFSWARALL